MSEADFSLISMFMGADLVVKSVMLMLIAASVWCWAIIINKYRELKSIMRASNSFEKKFWSDKSIKQLYDEINESDLNPLTAIFASAIEEYMRLSKVYRGSELQASLERSLSILTMRELDTMRAGTSFLATMGSTAPFIGLFGTVWGIIHSFQGIAAMQSTNLAVVAPGIAEALLATALGLIAAIPSVIGYNKISYEIDRYEVRMESFIQETCARLMHQNDNRKN